MFFFLFKNNKIDLWLIGEIIQEIGISRIQKYLHGSFSFLR